MVLARLALLDGSRLNVESTLFVVSVCLNPFTISSQLFAVQTQSSLSALEAAVGFPFRVFAALQINHLDVTVSLGGKTKLVQYVFTAPININGTSLRHESFPFMQLSITHLVQFLSFLHEYFDLVELLFFVGLGELMGFDSVHVQRRVRRDRILLVQVSDVWLVVGQVREIVAGGVGALGRLLIAEVNIVRHARVYIFIIQCQPQGCAVDKHRRIIGLQLNKAIILIGQRMKQYTPVKSENLKLKEKSEVVTSVTHASQRNYKLAHAKAIKYLNIDYFKLQPCSNTKQHQHKHCMNYHNAKDRKRFGNCYNEAMCEYISKGEKCPRGDDCPDSHSRVEQLYQHQTYKKKFCSHFPNNVEKCEYGDFCSFAHCEDEIRTELIHNYEFDEDFYMFHYKTEFCPFNLTEHDKALCVYAHNLQDYRRNPSYYTYEPIPCFNWKLKDYIYNYDLGCENGLNCNMCHGWKELQYHPNAYKTSKCLETKCRKGECQNFHSEKEKRVVDEDITNRYFKYVARNRIIQGIFKPETEQSFIPRNEIKVHTVIHNRNSTSLQHSDFAPKSEVHIGQHKSSSKEVGGRTFLGQSLAESDNESEDHEIQTQIDKLMQGE